MYEDVVKMPNIQHTFLIRDPKRAIYSYSKIGDKLHYKYEFDQSEAGYKELCEFYRLVKRNSLTPPIVIDAYNLQAHPAETMKQYCNGIGIQFESHMTSWKPGPIPGVGKCWQEWLSGVVTSTGFIQVDYSKQKAVPLDEMSKEVLDCIKFCQPFYEEMLADCYKVVLHS